MVARAGGFNPSTSLFADKDPEELSQMLTTGIEVLRMIRDDDMESEDGKARSIVETLFTTNQN